MSVTETKQVIENCYHCGNKGLLNIVGSHTEKFGGYFINENGEQDNDLSESFTWLMLSCPVCRFITLKQNYTNECYYDPRSDTQMFDYEVLYPENKINLHNVPKDIASSFEAALKIRNINSDLTLISLRKTLELICNEKKATGKTLDAKIQDLINSNIFPKEFKDASWIIRKLGNEAAHSNETTVHNNDVKEITNLLYTIINYLYVTPYKIKYLKEKIEDKSEES